MENPMPANDPKITIPVPPGLLDIIRTAARDSGRTLAAEVRYVLRRFYVTEKTNG
jgi:hypothetical protein